VVHVDDGLVPPGPGRDRLHGPGVRGRDGDGTGVGAERRLGPGPGVRRALRARQCGRVHRSRRRHGPAASVGRRGARMRVAVYAGTFDPVTAGHVSVIARAARVFDRVLVVIAINPAKTCLFSIDERLEMLRAATGALPNVECASTDGLVV